MPTEEAYNNYISNSELIRNRNSNSNNNSRSNNMSQSNNNNMSRFQNYYPTTPGTAMDVLDTEPFIINYDNNGEPVIEEHHRGLQFGLPTQNIMKVQKNSNGRFVYGSKGEKIRFARTKRNRKKKKKTSKNHPAPSARREPFNQNQTTPIRSRIRYLPTAIPVYNPNNNEPEEIELTSLFNN